MSDTQDLDAIKARYEATTPGVWDYITQGIVGLQSQSSEDAVSHPLFQAYKSEEDGVFVAHAHQDVPALIGEVERLTAELQVARQGREIERAMLGNVPATIRAEKADAWDEGWDAHENSGCGDMCGVCAVCLPDNPYCASIGQAEANRG